MKMSPDLWEPICLTNKQLTTLYRGKEQLKKEMLRKRALLEKDIHLEIQVNFCM